MSDRPAWETTPRPTEQDREDAAMYLALRCKDARSLMLALGLLEVAAEGGEPPAERNAEFGGECRYGHLRTKASTYVAKDGAKRCRTCKNEREYNRRRKQVAS